MRIFTFIVLLCVTLSSGCARWQLRNSPTVKYQSESGSFDTDQAKICHEEALEAMRLCNYREAEYLLRKALIADKTFGPAHNSLGSLYLQQRKYYLAAWEFEAAVQFMPGRGEPLSNLGLVYEQADQINRAIEYYEQAIAIDNVNSHYVANYVRARVQRGDMTSDMRDWLHRLVMLNPSNEWQAWARGQIVNGNFDQPENLATPAVYDSTYLESPQGPIIVDPNDAENLDEEMERPGFEDNQLLEPILENFSDSNG